MTAEFKKNNPTPPQVERPLSPSVTKPPEINRKPENQKKHITSDGKKRR